MKAARHHVKRNWRTAPAAKIKHRRILREGKKEALDAGFIEPSGSTAVSVPG